MNTSLLILVICVLTTVTGQVANGNNGEIPVLVADDDGQPGCATRFEFRRLWRNNLVPEQYWECTEWQRPARLRYCPVATRFQDAWQTCVPANKWEWMPFFDPPTRPGDEKYHEQCEEVIIETPDECKPTEGTTTGPSVTTTGTTQDPIITPPHETTLAPTTPETDTTTTSPVTPDVDTTVSVTTEWTTIGTIPLEQSTLEMTTATGAPELIFECVGAGASQHFPGWINCDEPPSADSCTATSVNRLRPTRDPYIYLECDSEIGWTRQRCPGSTCFDSARNTCVEPSSWRNTCRA